MVIAMDGPAGSGKSTIAKLLAQKLHFTFVNSGNLYRALTLYCIEHGVDTASEKAVLEAVRNVPIDYEGETVIVNGEDVTERLHSDLVDARVAAFSGIVPVRRFVNSILKRLAKKKSIVVEGRDMTTVVFPNAECRVYLDAAADVRAKRRMEQGGSNLSFEEIKRSIEERDSIDKRKREGSLRLAPGVQRLDTSGLTIENVCNNVMKLIKEKTMGKIESSKTDLAADETQTKLQEEYLKQLEQLEEGQLAPGVIVQITKDQVFVDVGYKSEGRIPLAEFAETPKLGDKLTVVLIAKENRHGEVIISKQKADEKIFWKNLRQAFQNKTPVQGLIEKQVKGGFSLRLAPEAEAFLPISQVDITRVDKPEKWIGKTIDVIIERLYSDGKINIIANRRRFLEEESAKKRAEFFERSPVGSEVDGVVKSFTSFGAFVDLGGFDGLLHVNEMSWGHVTRPRDFVKKGQQIRVKVVRIDHEEGRINLSLKHFTDDPWVHFEDKYRVNDIVKGRVTKLAEFGAFIELEEGIEGLAHISDLSWVKKIQKPGDMLSEGDEVECMILGYDVQAGRVSLGLKQVGKNPWVDIEEKYPVGTRLTRKIVKVTNSGAFIELEGGIDGFLHADDLSWTKKIRYPQNELKEGEEIEVIVLVCDLKTKHLKLGVKQLTEDPWQSFAAAYKLGSPVEGEVTTVTDFGIFLRMPGGIEGLIHKSNLSENKEDNADELLKKFKPGDKVKAVLIELSPEKQKVAFSIRDYHKKLQKDEMSRYMAGGEGADDGTFTLGDILKSKEKESE